MILFRKLWKRLKINIMNLFQVMIDLKISNYYFDMLNYYSTNTNQFSFKKVYIYIMGEVSELQQIEAQVKAALKLPTEDGAFYKHIANILAEEPPINGAEIYELVSDFFDLFHINRSEAIKKCDALFNSLKSLKGFLRSETKYKLTAEQLGKVVILEEELKIEDARQPLFAKKPTAGNSNT